MVKNFKENLNPGPSSVTSASADLTVPPAVGAEETKRAVSYAVSSLSSTSTMSFVLQLVNFFLLSKITYTAFSVQGNAVYFKKT